MYQPKELKSSKKLKWSVGRGVDVWQMFCECIVGNLLGVKQLLLRDASLAAWLPLESSAPGCIQIFLTPAAIACWMTWRVT